MVKSLEGGVMLWDDVFRLREGGQRRARPYPVLKHGWIAAELVRLKRFVFCLPKVLQAGLGAGGHRPWAVSRSEPPPAGEHLGFVIVRAAVARARSSIGRGGTPSRFFRDTPASCRKMQISSDHY